MGSSERGINPDAARASSRSTSAGRCVYFSLRGEKTKSARGKRPRAVSHRPKRELPPPRAPLACRQPPRRSAARTARREKDRWLFHLTPGVCLPGPSLRAVKTWRCEHPTEKASPVNGMSQREGGGKNRESEKHRRRKAGSVWVKEDLQKRENYARS